MVNNRSCPEYSSSSCGLWKADKEADAPTTFSYVYGVDPSSLDYSIATRTSTTDIIGNVVDGLLENDEYGNLVPSLAEDWSVSQDGLTYTYKLRKGVNGILQRVKNTLK